MSVPIFNKVASANISLRLKLISILFLQVLLCSYRFIRTPGDGFQKSWCNVRASPGEQQQEMRDGR